MRGARGAVVVAVAALLAAGCDPVADVIGRERTPHEAYAESLRDAGLADRALGAAWLAAADRALAEPVAVTLPYRETGFFPGDEAGARGFRLTLRRGERLVVGTESESDAPARLYVDVFEAERSDTGWRHRRSADSNATVLRHNINRDGTYLVRIQPELLRAVRYTLTIQTEATLAFPVQGHDTDAIRSAFGVDRDGGRRVHHGVDIFAPRGTPVLAAAEGRVEARLNRLGGKVVWQRVPGLGSIYYAHLDSQTVVSGTVARVGDTVGLVGNSGNAVTTPPHLHFGIYARPGGPVDPFPFIYEPDVAPPDALAADVGLGGLMRTTGARTFVRGRPAGDAEAVDTLAAGTVVRLAAGGGSWRRIDLPDGRTGFVPASALVSADEPLRRGRLAAEAALRAGPDSAAFRIASLGAEAAVEVRGAFGGWLLIAARDERSAAGTVLEGWVEDSAIFRDL